MSLKAPRAETTYRRGPVTGPWRSRIEGVAHRRSS